MCTQEFGRSLTELCGKFSCPPEALKLAEEFPEPAAFIAQLRSANMSQEAVQALARILPSDRSVEWAETCAQMAGEKVGISTDELQALGAAKTWSLDPTETNRMAAELAATKLPPSTPAMWTANAAAWSKQIQMPEGATALPIAGDLTARAVVGAVQLSAAMVGSGKVIEPISIPVESYGDARTFQESGAVQKVVTSQADALIKDQQAQAAKILEPFIDKGVSIAGSVDGFTCTDPLCSAPLKPLK